MANYDGATATASMAEPARQDRGMDSSTTQPPLGKRTRRSRLALVGTEILNSGDGVAERRAEVVVETADHGEASWRVSCAKDDVVLAVLIRDRETFGLTSVWLKLGGMMTDDPFGKYAVEGRASFRTSHGAALPFHDAKHCMEPWTTWRGSCTAAPRGAVVYLPSNVGPSIGSCRRM